MSRKVKYSKELKLSVVQKYLNGEESSPSLAKEIGTTNTIILRWVNKYKSFGENAFNVSYSNAAYTKEFKKQVVLDYLNGEGSYTDLMV